MKINNYTLTASPNSSRLFIVMVVHSLGDGAEMNLSKGLFIV